MKSAGSKTTRIVIAASRGPYREVVRRLRRKGLAITFIDRKDGLTARALDRLRPRYVFLPHWSYIVPREIYERHECVVFHMTDLPYGRGGSPLQNLILRGHTRTKISALRCGPVIDGGPVYMKRPLSLDGTAAEILARAAGVIERMIEEMVRRQPRPSPQRGRPTAFARRRPDQSEIRDMGTLRGLYDFIRMLDGEGYPRAFVNAGGLRIEFHSARLNGDSVDAKVVITRRKS